MDPDDGDLGDLARYLSLDNDTEVSPRTMERRTMLEHDLTGAIQRDIPGGAPV